MLVLLLMAACVSPHRTQGFQGKGRMLGQNRHMPRTRAIGENFLLSSFIPRREEIASKTDMVSGKLPCYLHKVHQKSQIIVLDPASLSVQELAAYEEIKRVSVLSSGLGFVMYT